MKSVVGIVVLMTAIFAGYYYGSAYVMGGLEAGMPGGGNGQFSDYHDGNLITEYLCGQSGDVAPTTTFTAGNVSANAFSAGDVTANPYAE
jgi:hypothetical protein